MSERTRRAAVIGVDVGGTFTDVVVVGQGGARSWKIPTSDPQSEAVIDALRDAGIGEESLFLHGTTVATNALLEESGARVVLVTTAGFEDLIEIGRQKRPSLYDDAANRPVALVGRPERLGHLADGKTAKRVVAAQPESVAVGLLGSYLDPTEERDLAKRISESLPNIPVSIGSEVSPGFREYERLESTVIDAYLKPLVGQYLHRIDEAAAARNGFVMTSAGGLVPLAGAAKSVGLLTLSGPAAGVVAVEALRDYHGLSSAIAFDMGGTSTDVCRVDAEDAPLASSQHIGGRINRVPSIPIHTVGAGGGSIAWVDAGGSLRVGPRSAGASPGPVAYGLGGEEPTVTDANLVLGHIPADTPLSGGLKLDAGRAGDAFARLGASLGLSAAEAASGVIEVVDSHMERAIRVVSVEEGFDPRTAVLVAYGGAGGLHAARLARRLQMRSVLIPPHAGVFSAVGLGLARPRHEMLRTVLCSPDDPLLAETVGQLTSEVAGGFSRLHSRDPTHVDVLIEGRFEGQSHEISVPYRAGLADRDIAEAHLRRFGFSIEEDVEIVNVRVVATGMAPLTWPIGEPTTDESPAVSNDSSAHLRTSLVPGFSAAGPMTVIDGLSTTLIAAGERVTVLDDWTLEITW